MTICFLLQLEMPQERQRSQCASAGLVDNLNLRDRTTITITVELIRVPFPLANRLRDGHHEGSLCEGGEERKKGIQRDVEGQPQHWGAVIFAQDDDDGFEKSLGCFRFGIRNYNGFTEE